MLKIFWDLLFSMAKILLFSLNTSALLKLGINYLKQIIFDLDSFLNFIQTSRICSS